MYRDFFGHNETQGGHPDREGQAEAPRATGAPAAIGKIQTASGAATIARANALTVQLTGGEFIYENDVIETGDDGVVGIVFVDGTTFHLYENSRVVLDQFIFGADGLPNSALLQVTKGKFGVLAGRLTSTGRFIIDTPFAKIQNVMPTAGTAGLGFMFLLCLIDNLQAGSESESLWVVENGKITYKDFEHGSYELTTTDGQHFMVDDPEKAIILHPHGSSVGVDVVTNDRAEIVELQGVYQRVYATFAQGLQDPFLQQLLKTSASLGSSELFASGFGNPTSLAAATLASYTPPPYSPPPPPVVLPPVIPGGVTTGATFLEHLPVNNSQTAPVYIGPTNPSHLNNVFLDLTLPSNELLTTVAISGLPAGETITSGTGMVYHGGADIIILAADFDSGLTLSNFTDTAATLTITATVYGAGGAKLTVTTLALTVDAPIGPQADAVHWIGPSGGDWNDPANWNTGAVPIPHQDVFIDTPGTVVSSGTVDIASLAVISGATLDISGGSFTIETSANAKPLSNAGVIVVAAGAAMTIGDAVVNGTVINSNLVQLDGGALTLLNVAITDTGGTFQINAGSVLTLSDAAIHDGLINNGTVAGVGGATGGTIHITGDTTLDSGVSLSNGVVNLDSGVTLTLNNISISGAVIFPDASTIIANGAFTVPVDASALVDNALLDLSGSAAFTVTNLIGDVDASGLSGALDVTTGSVAGLSIATGSGGNNIHAQALLDNQVLTLTGDDDASVGLKAGDLDASADSGVLTVAVTGAAASTNTITTGSNNLSIGDAGADAIAVDATKLLDNNKLTLTGAANVTVTHLIGDVDANGLSGSLNVTTGSVADLSITTGSGASNTIDASALTDNQLLMLTGTTAAGITLNAGDLDASADSGALTVTVTGAGSSNTITTGSNNLSVGDASAATIAVDALKLDDGSKLTLTGAAAFTVTNLIGDVDASGLSGALDVTTGSVAGLSIATGSGGNNIHAQALLDNQVLTLTGDDDASVGLKAGDLDASADSGVLTVAVTGAAASTNTITTGSNNLSIGDAGADAIAVDATKLLDNNKLTLTGAANVTVTHLIGDVDANGLSGSLNVTTGSVADLSITTGSGASNTIDASALTDNQLLMLTGTTAAGITLNAGDLDASADSGALTVTVTGAGSSNTITTGSNNLSVGDASAATIAVDALKLDDGSKLTLTGAAAFTVTNLIGDVDASGLSGALDVTTGSVAGLSIATGSGGNNIHAQALLDNQVLTLTGDDDASVGLKAGDLDASADSGVLTVAVTGAAASTNTITTGSNNLSIGDAGADAIAVDATKLLDNNKLTLTGAANVTVTHLIGDVDANGLSGSLNVTTGSVADLSITTGSGASNTIDASALTDNQLLMLTGTTAAGITLNAGDLDASADSGALTVTVTGAGSSNTITTGSNNLSVGDASAATIAVDALKLDDGSKLTLTGAAAFTVTNLIGDVDASGLSGALDVTTGSVAGLSIATGSGGNNIHAQALLDNQVLTLTGDDDASVGLKAGDLDASADSGVLTVAVTGAAASTNTITTGSNNLSIGDAGADAIAVDATKLLDNNKLTLTGAANVTVTHLIGDVDANGLSGSLNVTTGSVADLSITTGSGASNTIDASALTDNQLLMLTGTTAAGITLNAGDLDASADSGALTVTVTGAGSSNTITTGSNNLSVGDASAATIAVDALKLDDGSKLTLTGAAAFTVTNLIGDVDASGLSGALDVTTGSVAGLSIATGSGGNNIHAQALLDNQVLTLTGDDDASVGLKAGDLDASADSGVLTVAVTGAAASTNTITTGSNNLSIGDAGADAIAVDATKLLDNNKLTLTGAANVTVTHLIGDVDANGLSGSLNVTTGSVADLSITTGSGASNTIDASALTDNQLLMLTGTTAAGITLNAGDLDASADSGALTVTVTGAGSSNTITTGSNNLSVGDASAATIAVDALKLDDGSKLTLTGAAAFTVTNLIGDVDASGLSGALDVTTGSVAGLSIATGSGGNNIHAQALLDNQVLTLTGDDDASVGLKAGDLDASADSGVLTVAVTGAAASTNTITTGSNNLSIGDAGADAIAVDATKLLDNNKLTLTGAANVTVTHLIGDVDANGLSGSLNVTTGSVADLSITTGSGASNTIDASALTDNQLLMLTGTTAAGITLNAGDLDASADSGALTVTVTGAGSSNTITTGSNNLSVGDASAATIAVDALKLDDGSKLTLTGAAAFTVTNLIGDVDASGLSGALDVTTGSVAGLSIATGSGGNNIHAQALLDNQVLTLTGDDDASVGLKAGDLDASADSGVLTVAVTGAAASTNTITTGSNNLSIGDAGADAIAVDATKLLDNNKLTLTGAANVTVTHLIGDVDANGLSGSLNVTTGSVADLSITTGSGASNTIDASALTDNQLLMLTGTTAAGITLNAGDLDASADSGALTVTVTGAGSSNTITTGSNNLSVGDASAATIAVDALKLDDGSKLTLTGAAAFTVTNLIGDVDASGLSGALDVTTGSVAGLSIATGSGGNNIHAQALLDNQVLTLTGDDDASVGLKAGDLDASADSGVLTVAVTGAAASTNTITTGSNNLSIGDAGADAIAVDATKLLDNNKLTLTGAANVTVTHLIGDVDANGLSGSLNVTTGSVADLSITTGSGASNTIDASALTDNQLLMLTGTTAAGITLNAGDLDASADSGALTVTVTGAGSSNTITTGSNNLSVGDASAATIAVDALKLDDGSKLTLTGAAAFTVTNLIGDVDASGLSGALDVTTGSVAGLSIATGSGGNNIHAQALLDNQVLTLTGDDDASVGLKAGDLDASADSGVLTVAVTGAAASTNTITTGSNNLSIGDAGADAIAVDATKLLDNNKLTLTGAANVTVTHLIGDVDANGLSGSLNVTTGSVADLSITTGSGASNTIDASALTDNQLLMLTGTTAAGITLNAGDLDASADSGALTVTVTGAGSSNTITTGSNNLSVGDASAATIAVDALKLDDGSKLTLTGAAAFTVTNLIGDVDASGLSGALDVTTGSVAGLSIATGSGGNNIHAQALLDNQVLTLTGDDDASVGLKAGDLDASADSGVLTVAVTGAAASTNTITTGSNNLSIGDAGADAIAVDATKLLDNNKLTLTGAANVTVTHLIGDVDANGLSGSLNVTTGSVADLSITTGSGASNTIDASALTDNQLLMLTGTTAAGITLNAGDLDASADSGALTVTVTGAGSSNTITTGAGDDNVTLGGAQAGGTIDLGLGTDSLQLANGGNTLTVSNTETITGGSGDDLITLGVAQSSGNIDLAGGSNRLDLAAGSNTLSITNVALVNGTASDDSLTLTTAFTGGTVNLGDGNDTLILAAGANTLTANNIETIDATALTAGQTLTLSGSGTTNVSLDGAGLAASGYTGNITVTSGAGDNTITTGSGNDTIDGGAGNDTIDGGAGSGDTAVYTGAWLDYTITLNGSTYTIVDDRPGSPDGTDTVTDVEKFTFSNGTFTAAQIVNQAPTVADDNNAGDAVIEAGGVGNATLGDPTAVGNVLGNDSDANTPLGDTFDVNGIRTGTVGAGGGLTAVSAATVVIGTYGSLSISPDGSYTYTLDNNDPNTQALAANATGSDYFTYQVVDAKGLTSTAQITINVTGSNDAPVATDDTGSATEASGIGNATPGSNATGNVLGNDTDVDTASSNFTVEAVRTGGTEGAGTAGTVGVGLVGAHGTLTLDANGGYTYVVDETDAAVQALNSTGANTSLTDTFNYTMSDGSLTDDAVLTITVHGANDAPVTTPVTLAAIGEDSGARIITQSELLANATDVDSPPASLSAIGLTISTGNGALVDNHDGTWTYTPALNDDTTVSFSYQVTDGVAPVNASATLDITPVNDAPVVSIASSKVVNFDAFDVSGGGSIDGATLSNYLAGYGITITSAGPSADPQISDDRAIYGGGIVQATSGHNVLGESGGFPVSYTLTFAQALTSFEFDRVQENAGPSGSSYPQWSATAYDAAGDVLATVGESLTSVFGSPIPAQHFVLNGPNIDHVVISGNDEGFAGFANILTDSWILNGTSNATATTNEDTAVSIGGISVSDVDAGSAQIKVTLEVSNGTLTVNEASLDAGSTNNGASIDLYGSQTAIDTALASSVVYTPNANYNGSDTLTVTVDDQGHAGAGGALTDSDTVAITVNPVNDAPVISALDVSDTNIHFSVSDVDSSSFVLAAPFAAALGDPALTLGGNDLTPIAQASAVSGTLQVSDGAGGTASVIGLYLGTDGDDTANAPLTGAANAIYGFGGNDTLTGGSAGSDTLTGGAGNDTFVFTNFTHSLAANFDTVTDFVTGVNSFAIGHALTGGLTPGLGQTGTNDLATDLAAVLNSPGNLLADGAAEVTITGGSDAGTYVVLSGAVAGFDPATDAVVKLANAAVVHTGDFHV